MEHLFRRWDRFKKILSARTSILFLDYDGTLTPIVSVPEAAIIPKKNRELLKRLSKTGATKVAIVSGRSLKDVKRLVGVRGIIYAGNHGFEIEGPKIKFKSPVSLSFKATIKQVESDLAKNLSSIKGMRLENKGLTLSLHYRLVKKTSTPKVKKIFHNTTLGYLSNKRIRIKGGKKVFEIRPPLDWDKGKVVLWFLARQRSLLETTNIFPIYIGDDITDEDAFRALGKRGATVFVGTPRKSSARYYLRDTREVTQLLKRILELKHNRLLCQN